MSARKAAEPDDDAPIALLREEATNPHLLRGYGPLAVAVALVLLMTLLAPTVVREERVTRPRDEVTTTTITIPSNAP